MQCTAYYSPTNDLDFTRCMATTGQNGKRGKLSNHLSNGLVPTCTGPANAAEFQHLIYQRPISATELDTADRHSESVQYTASIRYD